MSIIDRVLLALLIRNIHWIDLKRFLIILRNMQEQKLCSFLNQFLDDFRSFQVYFFYQSLFSAEVFQLEELDVAEVEVADGVELAKEMGRRELLTVVYEVDLERVKDG